MTRNSASGRGSAGRSSGRAENPRRAMVRTDSPVRRATERSSWAWVTGGSSGWEGSDPGPPGTPGGHRVAWGAVGVLDDGFAGYPARGTAGGRGGAATGDDPSIQDGRVSQFAT